MKKYLVSGLFCSLLSFTHHLSAQQVISASGGSATYSIDSSGESDGVSLEDQNPNEITLLVGSDTTVNKKKKSSGISTNSAGFGIVNFTGTSSKQTKTYGTLGTSTLPLNTFNILENVEFNSNIWVGTVLMSSGGTASFQNTLNLGSGGLTYTNGGTVSIGKNGVINGDVGNTTTLGTLNLTSNSKINGNVNVNAFNLTGSSSTSLKDKGAVITGNFSAQNIDISNGFVLGVIGNMTIPGNTIIYADMPFAAPPIEVSGSVTLAGSIDQIHYTFGFEKAPKAPSNPATPIVIDIISAASGTSNPGPFPVTTNDARTSIWFGQISDGTLLIISGQPGSLPTPPVTVPNEPSEPWWVGSVDPNADVNGGTSDIFLNILPDASLYEGTDTDYVQGQLSATTMTQYGELLYQLYPVPALIGVANESFNTTKLFQKVWLEHLYYNRTRCGFFGLTDSCCTGMSDRIRVWTDGFGYHGRRSNSNPGKGYKVDIWGTTVGAEKSINDCLDIGVGFGYGYADLKKSQFKVQSKRTNTTNINNYQGTMYFSYNPAPWYMDMGFSLGWNRYQGKRYIAFRDIDRKAHSDYSGQNYSTFIATGYQYYCNNYLISPFATMMYYYLHIDGYKEKGAQSLNLKLNTQNYQFLESGLGLKASYLLKTCYGSFIPEVHTIWYHDYNHNNVNVRASFSQEAGTFGGHFRNTGPKVDQNTWNIGASVTCLGDSHLTLMLNYDFEASNHYFDNQGLIELSYIF